MEGKVSILKAGWPLFQTTILPGCSENRSKILILDKIQPISDDIYSLLKHILVEIGKNNQ